MTRNPLTLVMFGIIRLYRLIFSAWFGNQCRFYPTCSHYAEDAFKTHGFLKGFGLMVWRILRCNPWYSGPWTDPVPPKTAPQKTRISK
ncbi:MAG: membrane protein insertion efficiency factor YidD [Pseudobdellovibrionaceae bacterium]|nr:membrane protein insertion efficiency factor YidD [Pseudobdellovibrionaceae bacterium]